ncbi:hypothetical protein ILYODFUR_000246 [Ilyodon furcidens]|uniref:Uncharacterized protein n=1 Tax=Ilyodon furcidens TaxID=33524 RepID=A0ABV0STE1_9TELE
MRAHEHIMVNVIICSQNSMAANKSRKWKEICQSFSAERCLTKRGPRNMTAFLLHVNPQQYMQLKKGPPEQQSPQRQMTPILTPYRWYSSNTASMDVSRL